MTTNDDLARWIGSTETRHDTVSASSLALIAATLDRPDGVAECGTPALPWHWLHFLPDAPTASLGADGHPRGQGFLPPVPAPRRMWAGSRIEASGLPARPGEAIRRTSTIRTIERKPGTSGALVFLGLQHEIASDAGWLVREQQDLVYRDAPASGAVPLPGRPAPANHDWSREVVPTSTLLFRYSALTFNAHRIHYDRDYAMREEGYPGLVVHGPLVATLLLDLAYVALPGLRVRRFDFRATRPLFDSAPFHVCARRAVQPNRLELWSRDADGFVTTEASLDYERL